MFDPLNSLNELLSYLHHGAVHYYWSVGQEIAGKNILNDLDASSKRSIGEKVSLEAIEMRTYAPLQTSRETADPENRDGTGALCFKYDGDGHTIREYLLDPPLQVPNWL
jgi:hypothetical protein